jgi:hypothetical protein
MMMGGDDGESQALDCADCRDCRLVCVLALGWFVLGLKTGWSLAEEQDEALAAERSPIPEGT